MQLNRSVKLFIVCLAISHWMHRHTKNCLVIYLHTFQQFAIMLPLCLYIYLSLYLFICPSINPSIYLSIYDLHTYVYICMCLSVCVCVCTHIQHLQLKCYFRFLVTLTPSHYHHTKHVALLIHPRYLLDLIFFRI